MFFSFTIRLEDYETKLADRTLFLVTRYNCPTGEWWDNNDNRNYRVGFRKAVAASMSPLATPTASAYASAKEDKENRSVNIPSIPAHLLTPVSQQRSFSAPNTLRFTPMTGTLAGIPVVSSPSRSSPAPPMLMRTMSSPYPPSPSFPMDRDPPTAQSHHIPRPTSPTARETAARTGSYIRRKLSLSNYVAPGSSPTEEHKNAMEDEKKQDATKGLVTPPNTPPGTVRIKGVGLPSSSSSPPRAASPPPAAEIEEEVIGEIPSEQEEQEDDDDTPKEEKNLRLDTSSLPPLPSSESSSSSSPTEALMPFSPTSVSARPFLPFNPGGYLSPPTSRDASEDGSGEAGRTSPAAPFHPVPSLVDDSKAMRVVLPALGGFDVTNFLPTAHQRQPAESAEVDGDATPPSGRVDTSDSSYAAFVRQWCFAQSAPPTPGVQVTPRGVGAGGVDAAEVNAEKSQKQPWLGVEGVAGYGFPGFNFAGAVVGVNADVGMVGGELAFASSMRVSWADWFRLCLQLTCGERPSCVDEWVVAKGNPRCLPQVVRSYTHFPDNR